MHQRTLFSHRKNRKNFTVSSWEHHFPHLIPQVPPYTQILATPLIMAAAAAAVVVANFEACHRTPAHTLTLLVL